MFEKFGDFIFIVKDLEPDPDPHRSIRIRIPANKSEELSLERVEKKIIFWNDLGGVDPLPPV